MTKIQRGIQSIEVGGQLLLVLAATTAPMGLGDLARASGMDASKAHRYLVSFGKLGLVRQDGSSGCYELGPFAAQLGLAALQRLDPLREASRAAETLVARIGHTVAIAAHGPLGPTVVRIEESVHALHVNMRTGTVMSLLNTATGLVFAAYLPKGEIERMMEQEAIRLHGDRAAHGASRRSQDHVLREVRRHGLARAVGRPIPGINALSAPIFDFNGRLALAITSLGPSGTFDAAWNGALAKAIKLCAEDVSRRLGFQQDPASHP
jgi:DNA-binding IclR family transcriptional regulator